jgi:hypothetical protein
MSHMGCYVQCHSKAVIFCDTSFKEADMSQMRRGAKSVSTKDKLKSKTNAKAFTRGFNRID